VGVLVIELAPQWIRFGLPISAGVALYVGASDLVPEVNREPGIRMALVFFAGVAGFLLLRLALPAL
jgi:zinc transporter ZupT